MQDYSHDPIDLLGLDPAQPLQHLNLAGCDGFPPMTPQQLAAPAPMTAAIAPDYTEPDRTQPALRPYDLQQPGIDKLPEWSPDPDLPDITAYNKPYSVDFRDGLVPSPVIAQDVPTEAEIAASLYPGLGFPMLDVVHAVTDVDPPLPDLQNPQLTPDVEMAAEDRPGEMAPGALDQVDDQDDAQDYPESQMDASGINSKRARHMALVNHGLEG